MNTFNERDYFTGTAEYDHHFWDVMKGGRNVTDTLFKGSDRVSGGFFLPSGTGDKLDKAIKKESIFRNLATVIHAYNGTTRIYAKDCEDVAAWVPEGGSIPIHDAVSDFTRYPRRRPQARCIRKAGR